MTDRTKETCRTLLAAGIVGAGAHFALMLSTPITLMLLLIALLRFCWLEDNIWSDLERADELPPCYGKTLRNRERLLWSLFRIAPPERSRQIDPQALANALRCQADALVTGSLAALSVVFLEEATAGPSQVVRVAIGLMLLVCALFRADRFIETQRRIAAQDGDG